MPLGLPVEHEVVALSRELKQLHAVAHRSGLDAPPTLDSLRETWERFQRLLSLFLEHFEKSYSSAYGKIRAAVADHDLDIFRQMVPQNFTTLSSALASASKGERIDSLTTILRRRGSVALFRVAADDDESQEEQGDSSDQIRGSHFCGQT